VFDFRYHVVSLAAVFLALVFGILIGVGISGRGVLDEAERARLDARNAELRGELERARARTDDQLAAQEYVETTYDLVMADRLAGKGIALVFVGDVESDDSVRGTIVEAISDADGRPVRMRSLEVPIDGEAINEALQGDEELAELAGDEHLGDLGRSLGEEIVAGGETPLWDALSSLLVIEVSGPDVPADGVVVARTAGEEADDERTSRFLEGLYSGLAARVPAVAVETTARRPSLIDTFRRTNLSSVDNVDLEVGRVALAVLLAGGPVGHYGMRDGATLLPPVDPVPPPDE
jgi:hypothetical protein